MPDLPGRERYFQTRGLTPDKVSWPTFLDFIRADSFGDGAHYDNRERLWWTWTEGYGVLRDGRGVWADSRDK